MDALALIEIGGWSPAMVVLDAMEKRGNVRLLQTELNDAPGVCMKLHGAIADIEAAAQAAEETARAMQTTVIAHVTAHPHSETRAYKKETGLENSNTFFFFFFHIYFVQLHILLDLVPQLVGVGVGERGNKLSQVVEGTISTCCGPSTCTMALHKVANARWVECATASGAGANFSIK